MTQQVYYQGRCLCGAVRYVILERIAHIFRCHCQNCRKATGSAYALVAVIAKQAFRLSDGADQLRVYRSSPQAQRYFCGQCGSPIYAIKDSSPEVYRIRIGLIDEDIEEVCNTHIFVADKANWEQINDHHAQFLQFPE